MDAVGRQHMLRQAMGDFGRLVVRAFVGGTGVAVVLALAILALSANTYAATPNDARAGTLLFHTAEAGRYAVAPTVATEVAITVNGPIARTRVSQYFHNPGSDFVEGLYVFPLPEKAAVDRLGVRIGDRVIEGQVREKEEARRTYERARSEGRKAALVEQQRPNLFTNAVAHIGPNEYVVVTIEYQQALAYERGEYRLRFPLAVTPRYTPASALMPDEPKAVEAGAVDDDPNAPPLEAEQVAPDGCGPVNPVDIVVSIDAGVPIEAIASSYHEAFVESRTPGQATVQLVREQEEADRDFELTWRVVPGRAPQAAVFSEAVGGERYALVMVVPPQPTAAERAAVERLPRETILIVDTSGSMAGSALEQAKSALGVALATLTPRDRFNLVEFNSVMRPLFPQAMPVTSASLATARTWVGKLRADGGTEMAPALAFALDGRESPGYLRQVVFMTDGGVSDEEALFSLIARRLGASRLFTVGIGSAPNGHFMQKAAQFGRGTFTQVGDLREVEEKMSRLFEKIEAPVLRDVSIRWSDGAEVETFPARVPDLYLGEPIVVAAATGGAPRSIVVSGLRGNQPWSVALTPSTGEDAPGVGALWARARIASRMDDLRRGEDAARVRADVVKVALQHHLVSAYTSLVAVDVTPTAPAKATPAVLVKTALPAGSAMELPQTDAGSALHLLLGLLALGAAGIVTVIGRRA